MTARKAFAAIALAAAAAYGMTLWAPPIYDEAALITFHPVFSLPFGTFLARLVSARSLEFTGLGSWQILPNLLHYAAFPSTAAAHALGVLVHALAACGVAALALRLAPRAEPGAALLAGLAFVFFPPLTETVNSAAFLGHELALLFTLACLLAWLRAWEPGARREAWLGLSLACFAAGLLSKETAVIAPALLAAHTFCFAPGQAAARARKAWGFAALLAAYFVLRFSWLQPVETDALAPAAGRTWSAFGWYLRLMAVPAPLCLERDLPAGGAAGLLLWVLPVAFVAALFAARRSPFTLFCLLWLPVALAPVMTYIPAYSKVVDRYVTMAAPGLCLLAAHPFFKGRSRFAVYATLLVWGLGTLRRNGDYLEPERLFAATAACAPGNPRAQAMLGAQHLDHGDLAAARLQFERAAALDPKYVGALNGLALIARAQGRPADGEAALRRALAADPKAAFLHRNLADALAAQGKSAEAAREAAAARTLAAAEAPLFEFRSRP